MKISLALLGAVFADEKECMKCKSKFYLMNFGSKLYGILLQITWRNSTTGIVMTKSLAVGIPIHVTNFPGAHVRSAKFNAYQPLKHAPVLKT